MKRRLKFISSIMALTSAFAMLAYGVYSLAIERSVGISGTITFTSIASRASVVVYQSVPYGKNEAPLFSNDTIFNHSFSTETGDEAEKSRTLGDIDLNDTTPNIAFKVVVKSEETSKYVNLNFEVDKISQDNSSVVDILLNLEKDNLTENTTTERLENAEGQVELKPNETREFIFEYQVNSYVAEALSEEFKMLVEISQGGAYTPINQTSADVTPNLTFSMNSDGETATITGVTGFAGGDLILPDYYFTDDVNYPITVIGDDAFSEETINHIQLPMYLEEIGDSAFYFARVTFKQIHIPNSVKTIGLGAFYGNSSLTSLIIPSSVTTIEFDAFGENWSLTAVLLQEGLISIGGSAFQDAPINRLSIPNSVTTIGNNAFAYNQLIRITVPNTVTAIEEQAFGWNQLRRVVWETSVAIPEGAFHSSGQDFNKIESFTITSTSVVGLLNINAFDNVVNMTVYVPSNLISNYQNAANWSDLYNNGRVNFVAIT